MLIASERDDLPTFDERRTQGRMAAIVNQHRDAGHLKHFPDTVGFRAVAAHAAQSRRRRRPGTMQLAFRPVDL
jgi:hypothetical protein